MSDSRQPGARSAAAYLRMTADRYVVGQEEYYARLALEQAVIASSEGNYGIGAIAVVVTDTEVLEYPARNAMLTGLGVVDHAETRAILAARGDALPARRWPRDANAFTAGLPLGTSVYGTLEPCPMCVCALTNGGVVRSVSTVPDGALVQLGEVMTSDGGSTVLGEKWYLQPHNWRWLQQRIGLRFDVAEIEDETLRDLSWRVFVDTARKLDEQVARRALDDHP
jgi:tRNA(Arg) A34 adenosine deaminase TadA